MVSRITFLECGGNSAPLFSPEPIQDIHHQPEGAAPKIFSYPQAGLADYPKALPVGAGG
jgi:hypothetical protein